MYTQALSGIHTSRVHAQDDDTAIHLATHHQPLQCQARRSQLQATAREAKLVSWWPCSRIGRRLAPIKAILDPTSHLPGAQRLRSPEWAGRLERFDSC